VAQLSDPSGPVEITLGNIRSGKVWAAWRLEASSSQTAQVHSFVATPGTVVASRPTTPPHTNTSLPPNPPACSTDSYAAFALSSATVSPYAASLAATFSWSSRSASNSSGSR
jgi:hypothetical protein